MSQRKIVTVRQCFIQYHLESQFYIIEIALICFSSIWTYSLRFDLELAFEHTNATPLKGDGVGHYLSLLDAFRTIDHNHLGGLHTFFGRR